MVKEAEDEAQYDEIRQKAEARIWDQRDAQLKAQHDAREALMQQASHSVAAAVIFVDFACITAQAAVLFFLSGKLLFRTS